VVTGESDWALGIRRDVDLNRRWWHRLAKVVYFSTLGLVVAIGVYIIWDAADDDSFPAQRGQVTVVTSLGKELSVADDSVPNVVPIFLSTEGRLGFDDGSKKIQAIYDFQLERSFCSPAPLKHTEAIAAFLNNRDYSSTHTAQTVANSILLGRKAEDAKDFCWMQEASRNKAFDDIIKYEFTTFGFVRALWDYSVPFIAWVTGIHVVLLNIYYRGVVYVIVGPRRGLTPRRDDDDDDELRDLA